MLLISCSTHSAKLLFFKKSDSMLGDVLVLLCDVLVLLGDVLVLLGGVLVLLGDVLVLLGGVLVLLGGVVLQKSTHEGLPFKQFNQSGIAGSILRYSDGEATGYEQLSAIFAVFDV